MYILQESASDSEQVPPEVQWVNGVDNYHESPRTKPCYSLLDGKFKLENPSDLSASQLRYSDNYFRAMIQPFKDYKRW
jgi:hypothetical protein